MRQWYMIALVGKDRAGIVAQITEALLGAGATLGETSMMRLGCNFTIMMMVGMDGDESKLCRVVEPVAKQLDLHFHVDEIEPGLHQHQTPDLRITVYGADRPGIVAQVTSVLAESEVNITDLDSQVGGDQEKPIYILMIEALSDRDVEEIEDALNRSTDGVNFRIEEIDTLIG
ncbi:MAG: ACT domain-containing protein [Thiotrichales bacterium]|jgi:glycine cleavage system transcriptional repressor|nr:ACT domain-containing protein [Thiotrichales bacterium]MBT3612864.1 ACT domain-containing protein [Thiotrichales bacterium]MBT3752752.1 ACT domain-containing protein [Thiotrichales bacterium]MBT3836765.1 ACT domain-containing protein [Thiotrichales bacterium]MBT4152405.1 ACT domain-containing protein [Thiotrichales bacterium]